MKYHVSYTKNRKKILKIGLIPKCNSKIHNYPERVYCFNKEINFKEYIFIIYDRMDRKQFELLSNDGFIHYDVYEVTNNDNIIWHYDSHLKDFVFTYDNIAPSKLKIIETIKVK